MNFVSVIIPNYNHAPYLDERIKSVLNQTYTNFELIVLDDCSTDNSLDVIRKYEGDKRFTAVVRNEVNAGSPFSQWKKGISIAKGDIIWIAESDDACDETFLEELVYFYQKNSLVMAFTLSKRMNSSGIIYETIQKGISEDIIMKGNDYISNHISLITNASSCIFSRACALKIDNNYSEYKGTGDWLFWTGIASQGNVGVLAKPLNYYRVYSNNTTSKMFSNGHDFFELRRVYSYLSDNKYWSRWNTLKNSAKMVYAIKYVYKYENEKIRADLLKEWNSTSLFNRVFCFIMKGMIVFKKTIKL